MLFNSYEFILLFLPAVFFVFFRIARHSQRAAAGWLVLASLFFYGWWNPRYVTLLLASIIFNFFAARVISWANRPGLRAGLLALSIASDLLLLAVFKYANFFVDIANDVTAFDIPATNIVLPLGISFFTFTQITFLVDVYRKITRDYDFINYLLFVTYFPHLIAGPLLHHKQMIPQFENADVYRIRPDNLAAGLTIFTIGLAKKVLLADNFSAYSTAVFGAAAHGQEPGLLAAWVGTLAYTLQIYFDFSGYSDMAIGISRLFNIRLPLNFNSPYKAHNIIEFWRRWHMTLSQFLKDYLYIPLGGNRHGLPRRYVSLMVTILLGGLWHGANWTFVVWGGLHGSYLIANHAWRYLSQHFVLHSRILARSARVLGIGLTFFSVSVAWVIFRSADFNSALLMLSNMFIMPADISHAIDPLRQFFGSRELGLRRFAFMAVLGLTVVWFLPNTQQYIDRIHSEISWRADVWTAVAWGALAACCLVSMVSVSEFLYFQF